MKKALKEMPYAQAVVIIDENNNTITLRSYNTNVAVIENDWLSINGLYSMTTRKHLKAFCKEYAGFDLFSTIRTIANDKLRYNIVTGEVVPV